MYLRDSRPSLQTRALRAQRLRAKRCDTWGVAQGGVSGCLYTARTCVAALETELETEKREREKLMEIMRQQRQQIEQMAANNAMVLQELEKFKSEAEGRPEKAAS